MTADDSERWRRIGSTNRRKLLMALGAGTAVGLAGQGAVFAQEGDDGDGGVDVEPCPPCIDQYSGYLSAAGVETGASQEFEPAQTVELRVSDADVVFVEEDGQQDGGPGAPGNETDDGAATETNVTNGNVTAGNETVGEPANETDDGAAANETEGEGPGPMGQGGFPDFYFDPVGISVEQGDVVEYTTREEFHTVTAYHPRFFGIQQRVPENVPGFTSPPFLEDDTWYYQFDEPGVYDLQCLPHESLGMVTRVVVTDDSGEAPEAPPAPGEEEMGPSEIPLKVLNAPELEPQNIIDQVTVPWEDLTGVESELPIGP
jgi:plastocyanin